MSFPPLGRWHRRRDRIDCTESGCRAKKPGEKSDYTSALEDKVDALFVFRTTAQKVCRQTQARIVELPAHMRVTAQYGIAVLTEGNPAGPAFVDYIQSEKSKALFRECGFKLT